MIHFFQTVNWEGLYGGFRIVFIVLDVILFVAAIIYFAKGWRIRPPIEGEFKEEGGEAEEMGGEEMKKEFVFNTANFAAHWAGIEEKAREGKAQSLMLAVISADNLVDSALKQMGLPGEHMADRLQHFTYDDFNQIEDLWRAHKLRNELVHTPGFELKKEEAEEMLRVYESFLRTIRALK
jgi:hypothetical protein